jgi:hypothetical protein
LLSGEAFEDDPDILVWADEEEQEAAEAAESAVAATARASESALPTEHDEADQFYARVRSYFCRKRHETDH